MQASFDITVGKARLAEILKSYPSDSAHWNEAQNRFQFIDRLMIECLGWEHPNMEVEVRDEAGGISDYILGKPAKAVLEAKREAKAFDFLPGTKPGAVRVLRGLVDSDKNLREVVTQVLPYCVMSGAQIAVVCNGPQLVLFQALIPGHSPLDGEAFVFNGFLEYLSNFALLWRLLSPEGITENRALRDLASFRNPRIPPKAVTVAADSNAYRYRSEFQENLRALGTILLDDIDDNPDIKTEFYRDCYVPVEANNRHLLLSKSIIAARYKRVGDNGVSPAKVSAKTVDGKLRLDESLEASRQAARPVVVVGDVGVGKTSFFENLYEGLNATQRKKTIYIHIDLGEKANLALDVKTHVLRAVPQLLKERYGISTSDAQFVEKLYSSETEEFERSIEGQLKDIDPIAYQKARIAFLKGKVDAAEEHLKAVFRFLTEDQKFEILLVVDNADQRSFETQQEAFLIAQELAATRHLLVFVALRPSTFYRSKLSGALSGYQNRLLTISPPPADEVIRKRITFAVRVAEGKAAPAALKGVGLDLTNVVLFLNATLRSIRSSDTIKSFLGNITGGNIRMVIELISSFCGSPNVEAEKIVNIERQTGAYQVPLHEFTKHALLGEHAYFNSLSSLVGCNVFDVSAADPKEHFLASLLVAYVGSPMGIRDNDGFVPGTDIVGEMSRLGFVQDQTRRALVRLAEKRLIETPHGHYRELPVSDGEPPEQFHFRATSVGLYHIRFWVGDFSFLDATALDTPIFDTAARGEIFATASSFDIAERHKRAVRFRRYLEEVWISSNFAANYYDVGPVFALQNRTFESVERFMANPGRAAKMRQRTMLATRKRSGAAQK